MYMLRTKDCSKFDLEKRWALPDRMFFACGACQVLAHVFLARYYDIGAKAIWVKPDNGQKGNHIIVSFGNWVFDYHGYTQKHRYLEHYWKRSRFYFPHWDGKLVDVSSDALTTSGPSKIYSGLWLRTPDQFFKNALPRANAFLDNFKLPPK